MNEKYTSKDVMAMARLIARLVDRLDEVRPLNPPTIEIVVYDDGTSAISYFARSDNGEQVYQGRDFRDAEQTRHILEAIAGAGDGN